MKTLDEALIEASKDIFENSKNENIKIIAGRMQNDKEFRIAFCIMMTRLIKRCPQLLEDLLLSLVTTKEA